MMKRFGTALLAVAIAAGASSLTAQTVTSGLRGPAPLNDEGPAPPMFPNRNTSEREVRNYPEQPPVIPHRIDGYQVDKSANKCMTCHSRTRIEESKAIPIPATHYMDRDGQILGDVSTRRYFCTQCHVPQAEAKPLVENRYQDFDTVVRSAPKAPAKK